jgi:uncharacterized protein (TIGR03083 family)
MEIDRHIAVLQDLGERLATAAATADLDARVPTCPDWKVRDLLRHVGGVHRWATAYVLSGKSEPTTDEEDAAFFAAVPDDRLLPWYRAGHASLVTALRDADPVMSCWTFLPAPTPLAFWARRQAHETAIHCVDAEASVEWPSRFPGDFAADGIDELLNGFFARPSDRLTAGAPVTLSIRTTDTGHVWTIQVGSDRRVMSSGVTRADCTLAGPASDLYLLLWNRRELGPPVDIAGDGRVMDLWRARATIRWG